MPTVRGATLLGGAGLLWLIGRLLAVDELHVAAVASAALVALAWVLVRLPGDRVAVRRVLGANRVSFDDGTDVALQVRSDSRLPTPELTVNDEVPAPLTGAPPRFVVDRLARGRAITLHYRLSGRHRGRYQIGPAQIRACDPFGLVRRTRRTQRTDELVVYPPVEPLPDPRAKRTPQARSEGDQHRVLDLGDEFHTMREYVQGDDLRRVHWPSTARRNKLMVRQHELPWRADATILLDTRGGVHTTTGRSCSFETAVSAAASVACHLAERQHRLRLATEQDATAPPVVTRHALLDRLAVIGSSTAPNLGAICERLRTATGEGLFLACVAPPPGGEPVANAPDTRALLHAGRTFATCAAIVVHPVAVANRAEEFVGMLRTAGWRAVALPAGSALAPLWPALVAQRAPAAT